MGKDEQHANDEQKRAGVATSILDKVNFKIESIIKDKKAHIVMRKGWIHQQDITTITSTESPSRAEAGEASVRSAGLGKWHKGWRRGKGKRDPGVKWDWAAGGDRTRRVLWAQWGTPTFTRRVKAFYPHVLCVLSPSVVSNSLWPYGLSLARLLCPWGVSRQEYWSGLPCLPLYPHTYSQLIFNKECQPL